MFDKKEVSPAEMRKLNEKSFKKTQAFFRRRLRKLAAGGHNTAEYEPDNHCCGDRVADWLKSLGFTVKQIDPSLYEISWLK